MSFTTTLSGENVFNKLASIEGKLGELIGKKIEIEEAYTSGKIEETHVTSGKLEKISILPYEGRSALCRNSLSFVLSFSNGETEIKVKKEIYDGMKTQDMGNKKRKFKSKDITISGENRRNIKLLTIHC